MRSRPPTTQDGGVGRFAFLPGLAALGQYARRAARMSPTGSSALASTHRMADRIHAGAAIMRATTHPPLPPRFSQADVHMVRVANRADRGPAIGADPTDFTGRQSNLRPAPLPGGQRGIRASAAAKLTTPARLHLQIV